MSIRLWWMWVPVLVVLAITLGWTIIWGEDWGDWLLNATVLLVAVKTLEVTLPRPAEIEVVRQDELHLGDLLFFLVDLPDGRRVPRDFLLQLHVAVCNVGGQKGVLSSLRLSALIDAAGHQVSFPDAPEAVAAHQAVYRRQWEGIEAIISIEELFPPFVLDPNDVLSLRFRMRRGIDWSPQWDLDRVRSLGIGLRSPVTAARITCIYRRGPQLVTENFTVPLQVQQQEAYVDWLERLTQGFSTRPSIPLQEFGGYE